MGVSDRPYLAARGHRAVRSGLGAPGRSWAGALAARTVGAGRSSDESGYEFVRATLGPEHTALRFFDRFADDPGVEWVDFNDLKSVPDEACNVLVMSRGAYMIRAAEEFLDHARRIIRPGGIAIVDWLHGRAEASALDLLGMHDYGRHQGLFITTYCDPQFIAEFPGEFDAFPRHVNRPPWWVNLADSGRPLSLARRVERQLFFRRQGPEITRANCLDAMRPALSRAGKRLIERETLAQYFTILFREAGYFYRLSGKFHLYLLTVLRPVGK